MTITKELKENGFTFYENVILESIDLEVYGFSDNWENYDKIMFTYQIFKREYGFMISRIGEQAAFTEWLMGLPSALTVPFYYHEQIELINGYFPNNHTSDDEKTQTFFDNCTNSFFTLKNNL